VHAAGTDILRYMTEKGNDPVRPRPSTRGGRRGRGTRPMHPERPCLNCGDPTPGDYCATCGQRKVDVQVSVRALVVDVLEDQFILDKRLPRTLGSLLFRPGHLTVEYVNGRMVRYIHPFRLYLVTSIIFFLLLSFFSLQLVRRAGLDGEPRVTIEGADSLDAALEEVRTALADTTLDAEDRVELQIRNVALRESRRQLRLDSLATAAAELEAALGVIGNVSDDTAIPGGVRQAVQANRGVVERQLEVATAQRDSLLQDSAGAASLAGLDQDRPIREVWNFEPTMQVGNARLDTIIKAQLNRLADMPPREAVETVAGTFFNYVPTMMFILLPVFAGLLKLLYVRRRRYYAEHFVFLLHVHSVVFILASIMLLTNRYLPAMVELGLGVWILVYIYLAMKRVYGQNWLKTLVKYWTLGWMYFWILTFSIPIAFIATLLLF